MELSSRLRLLFANSASKLALILLLLFVVPFATNSSSTPLPLKNTVIIPLNNWSSQRVISNAIGKVLQAHKYPVEYRNINSQDQWGAMARGLVHFQIEVWEPSMDEETRSFISKKRILDLGSHSAKAVEDWWYPDYVAKLCPGLPDWRALNRCAALFAQGNSDKGSYYTGPWNYRDPELIRSLGLDFTLVRLDDAKSIWHQLSKAMKHQQPIIMLNWSPNWTDARIPGEFIHFPTYHPSCESDPSWGVNPNKAYDCGNKKNAWIKKYAWPKFEQKFPCVYQFITQIDLSNEMISEAAALADFDDYSEKKAAELWLQKFSSQVQQWSKSSCISRQ